jgi:hypothetical protein
MIHPNSPYKRIWDLFVFLCITYFAIEVPIRLVFPHKLTVGVTHFERFIQIIFGIDLVLNFFTSILKDRLVIQNKKIVAKTYLKSWFLIDFLSAFPFDLFGGFFFEYFGVTDSLKILRLLRSVRVFELFKSLRMLALGADSEDRFKLIEVINPMTFRLIFFVYWTSLFAHWVACGWIYLTPEFLADKDIYTRYIRSLYWSVTTLTTIGYGDITPTTNSQTIYTMGVMILGVGIYGYVIGNISTLLSNLDISRVTFQEKLNTINSFIKYKKLPPQLANRIRSYYINLWENKHGIDETEIWNQLPSGIKIDVSMFLHNHLISVVPFFKNAPEELKREVVLELKPVYYMKGDVIFREGDVPHNMYFLSKGHVEVIKEKTGELLATLNSGSFFGEMSLIDDSLRTATIRAGSYCDVYTLSKDAFSEILRHHPSFAKHINVIALERKQHQSSFKESDES